MYGGTNERSNLAAACWHCNHLRGTQMNATKQRKEAKAKTSLSREGAECVSSLDGTLVTSKSPRLAVSDAHPISAEDRDTHHLIGPRLPASGAGFH